MWHYKAMNKDGLFKVSNYLHNTLLEPKSQSNSSQTICSLWWGNWMSACWSPGAITGSSSYSFSVLWCLHSSNMTSRFFICFRNCNSKLLY
jgi:hypothetical protein